MIKRIIDILASTIGLVILLPVLLAVAAAIRLTLGAPVLFRQTRPGRNAVPFTILKFRTMRNCSDEQGRLLPDEARLTALGKFLRSTSLDELLELWNVMRGDMSLVGPRPLLMEYLPRYSPQQARRHAVRPGLTGWAQVNGRNSLSWDEKFRLDIWYVDNHSFWLDLKILVMTVAVLFSRRGISADNHVTMSPFQ